MKLKRQLTDFRKLNGGHRPGSGAKKKDHDDKQSQIRFGLTNKIIRELGGKDVIAKKAKEYFNSLSI